MLSSRDEHRSYARSAGTAGAGPRTRTTLAGREDLWTLARRRTRHAVAAGHAGARHRGHRLARHRDCMSTSRAKLVADARRRPRARRCVRARLPCAGPLLSRSSPAARRRPFDRARCGALSAQRATKCWLFCSSPREHDIAVVPYRRRHQRRRRRQRCIRDRFKCRRHARSFRHGPGDRRRRVVAHRHGRSRHLRPGAREGAAGEGHDARPLSAVVRILDARRMDRASRRGPGLEPLRPRGGLAGRRKARDAAGHSRHRTVFRHRPPDRN